MTMSLFHICEIVQIVFGSFQKISGMKIRKAILSCNMKGPHANVFLSWLMHLTQTQSAQQSMV